MAYDIEIYKGSTFTLGLTLRDTAGVPIDLTSYNVSGFLKYRYSDSNKLVSLNASKTAPFASGIVSLSIPSSGTESLPVGYAFYDIEIYHTGLETVDKVLVGKASIYPEVTY